MGPAAMTVLCLVEQDAGEAADASLRALTFAARLAGAGPVPVAAVLFGPADQVPGSALAAHGAASAHVVEPGHSSGASLATARVVVGGGRGVGGPDGFAPLEELAGLLGSVVGVSRVVTSEGWRPHRQQVGQTGTKITPELYLACGISGAIQHIAGC